MPKINRRRYSTSTSDEFGRIQNVSVPPRKVSFDTNSEDEESSQSSSYSISSLPTLSLDHEHEPQERQELSASSSRSFNRKQGGFMKRPTPSVCLSAMGSQKRKSSNQIPNQVNSTMPCSSEPLSPCWGQFVDVIPHDTEPNASHLPYNSQPTEESSSTFGYQPYPSRQIRRRRVLSPKKEKQLDEGFLPGFVLSVPFNSGEAPQPQDTESPTTGKVFPRKCLSTRDVVGALQSLTF
mmetsp:Transcript_5108/g.7468  ORF Transcript_5108/g.7468 Transcript_5108/m.7468 type:complete len:237 (+) Transcript_5108:197-907(+)